MHYAQLTVDWRGSFDGEGRVTAPGFSTGVSLPKEFGGLNQGASPEDLFLSAVASCYVVTLGIILQRAEIKCEGLRVDARLTTTVGRPSSIDEVNLDVHVVTDTAVEVLQRLSERVDDFCVVGRTLNDSVKKTVQIRRLSPREGVANALD